MSLGLVAGWGQMEQDRGVGEGEGVDGKLTDYQANASALAKVILDSSDLWIAMPLPLLHIFKVHIWS